MSSTAKRFFFYPFLSLSFSISKSNLLLVMSHLPRVRVFFFEGLLPIIFFCFVVDAFRPANFVFNQYQRQFGFRFDGRSGSRNYFLQIFLPEGVFVIQCVRENYKTSHSLPGYDSIVLSGHRMCF